MHPGHHPHKKGHDPKEGMTIVLAITAAFFGGPELFHHTVDFVFAFAQSRYGTDLAGFAVIGWAVIIAAFTYYAARITFDIALVSALLALATRFF